MRQRRLKAPASFPVAHYHCVSRVVNRDFLFGPQEREHFVLLRRLMEWRDDWNLSVVLPDTAGTESGSGLADRNEDRSQIQGLREISGFRAGDTDLLDQRAEFLAKIAVAVVLWRD